MLRMVVVKIFETGEYLSYPSGGELVTVDEIRDARQFPSTDAFLEEAYEWEISDFVALGTVVVETVLT